MYPEQQQPRPKLHLPSPETTKYAKDLLELVLLLLTVPWILYRFLTHPRETLHKRENA